ncbi:signal recognition particle receptor alpha subunit Srp101 [Schizosaccharomyces japonicus yFS275]|uniref:Signal recognition particle receptor subunit alpha homolog n=1 Tax=Schizosaccharomyces japonicus (strain yFS275 / FY16936) TaxID=402676 RepID=B6JY97_SCHJY|nr:signal recognition particle receptor alpha subunit Srp101 [Schizosaccharomyces japonicus yFS275]EEB06515.2 signal recognition particle receptor alpha subunit Srp101 [Schizosaccharomyces japonicus yFS275]
MAAVERAAFQNARLVKFADKLTQSMHNIVLNSCLNALKEQRLFNKEESQLLEEAYQMKTQQLREEFNDLLVVKTAANTGGAKPSSSSKSEASTRSSKLAPQKQKKQPKKATTKKELRRWDDSLLDEEEAAALNYSEDLPAAESAAHADAELSSMVGENNNLVKTKQGAFVIEELERAPAAEETSSRGFSFFSNLIGQKTLTEKDLKPVLAKMQQHLIEKNVAQLGGPTALRFTSFIARGQEDRFFRNALLSISLTMFRWFARRRPDHTRFLLLVSTALESRRLCRSWLTGCCRNKLRILVAACDTFRSGAIEQLNVHVTNLKKVHGDNIELFAQGYGKDASIVVKNAVQYASQNNFDVILVDTAGRRHNDQRLMGSLEKFTKATKLDKIFQVAEALVGTDSLAQAKHFQASLYHRRLDGFIISKVDAVGELVGVMVGMVYTTHVPIVFVGVGQTYSDLRTLSVDWVVDQLMR